MTRWSKRLGSLALASFALASLAIAGCKGEGCGGKHDEAPAPSIVVEPPVPAPAGLLAEMTIAGFDGTWQRVQRGVGGTAGILPSTLGGVVCAGSGIDPTLAPEVDGASAAYVVVAGDVASPGWVIAARLVDARRARAQFVDAENARFSVRAGAGGVDVLEPKGGHANASSRPVVALSKAGFLVVARNEADLGALAPYATRTMPARVAGKEAVSVDVPAAALAGPLRSALGQAWTDATQKLLAQDRALRESHGGRAPDYGDPQAILATMDAWVQAKLAVLADLKGAHAGLEANDADLRATITAAPASPGGPASVVLAAMRPGDSAPLKGLPRDVGIAVLARDDADMRAHDGAALEAALTAALGARLEPADAKRVHGALEDWVHGRGDWMTVALAGGGSHGVDVGLLVDAPAVDAERAARAVRGMADTLAHAPAFRGPLTALLHVKDVTVGPLKEPTASAGATAATFTMETGASFELAWAVAGGDVRATLALRAPKSTSPENDRFLSPPPAGGTLGDDPAMLPLLDLGAVAGAIVAQPGRGGCAGAPGGVVLAWSRRAPPAGPGRDAGEGMWAEVEASDATLRCLVKAF